MKKLLIALLIAPLAATGQITLEHSYTNKFPLPVVVHFSNSGKKILAHDTSSQNVNIYDMQHNLWKSIPCPWYPDWRVTYIYAVSDNLFNSDNNVEMGLVYTKNSGAGYKAVIIGEAGNVMQDLDSAYQLSVYKDENDNYKLFTYAFRNNQGGMAGYDCKVYSVPGTMPCDDCNSLKVGSVGSKKSAFISEPMPNPSTGKFTINFMLPEDQTGLLSVYNISGQLMNQYPVTSNQTSITIENSLPAGTYLYNIQVGGSETETKKLVIR